jgi:hypothetical protein
MRKVLLRVPCRGRLYPIPSNLPASFQKYASTIIKMSSDWWHNRFGHPSSDIVHRVICDNNLSCSIGNSQIYEGPNNLRGPSHKLFNLR